jgi:hypothetical protein
MHDFAAFCTMIVDLCVGHDYQTPRTSWLIVPLRTGINGHFDDISPIANRGIGIA